MKKILLGIVIAAFAWSAWQRVNQPDPPTPTDEFVTDPELVERPAPAERHESFSCDGRTHCSEMNSCKEATYFLRHCPGVKMDGDNDGIPCEDQFCGH
jgi:hypothetical protein